MTDDLVKRLPKDSSTACSTAAAPISQERDEVEPLLVSAFKRGFCWCVANGEDTEYLNKAACDYADATMTMRAQRSANDVSERVNPNASIAPEALSEGES